MVKLILIISHYSWVKWQDQFRISMDVYQHTKHQGNHLTFSSDIGNVIKRALPIWHRQFVVSMFIFLHTKKTTHTITWLCFFRTLWECPDMPDINQQNRHNQFVTSIDIWMYDKKPRRSLNLFQWYWWFLISEYFGHIQMCDKTHQNDMINFQHSWMSYCKQKNNIYNQLFLQKLQFKESCNLIGWEHLGL